MRIHTKSQILVIKPRNFESLLFFFFFVQVEQKPPIVGTMKEWKIQYKALFKNRKAWHVCWCLWLKIYATFLRRREHKTYHVALHLKILCIYITWSWSASTRSQFPGAPPPHASRSFEKSKRATSYFEIRIGIRLGRKKKNIGHLEPGGKNSSKRFSFATNFTTNSV